MMYVKNDFYINIFYLLYNVGYIFIVKYVS